MYAPWGWSRICSNSWHSWRDMKKWKNIRRWIVSNVDRAVLSVRLICLCWIISVWEKAMSIKSYEKENLSNEQQGTNSFSVPACLREHYGQEADVWSGYCAAANIGLVGGDLWNRCHRRYPGICSVLYFI